MTKLTALIQFQRFGGGFQARGRPACAQENLKNSAGLVRQSHDGVPHDLLLPARLLLQLSLKYWIAQPSVNRPPRNRQGTRNIRNADTSRKQRKASSLASIRRCR